MKFEFIHQFSALLNNLPTSGPAFIPKSKISLPTTGKVGTLFREKNQVKQVSNGQECGITVKDYIDFQKNDTIEAFSVKSTERSI